MELTALALRSAAQKLRPYFQAHPVIVLTDQPLRNILHKPDLTGRMLQWAIELSEFGIEFQPRLSMKGQVMADFVLEYSRRPSQHHESSKQEWWTLRVDGASRSSGSGVGLLLQSPTGEHLEQAIRLGFSDKMRPSCPDWTSPLLYPSPNSGSTATHNSCNSPNGQSKKSSELTIGALTPWPDPPAIPLRQPSKRPRVDDNIAEYLQTGTLPEIQTSTQNREDDLWHIELIRKDILANNEEDAAAYVKNVINVKVGPSQQPCPENFLATDYFSKWVEAEAYASIKDKDVTNIAFRNFCSELNIRNSYSTPRYPQRATRRPMGLSNHTRTPTGNTPFALAYGMDAVIPTEIGLPTIRTDAAKQNDANTELGRNLDWADEVREKRSHPDGRLSTKSIRPLQSQTNSRSSSSFCAVKRSCKSSFCFFSIEASVRSCLTSPLSRAISSLPHAGGPPSIPPGSLPQPNPPGGPHSPPSGG
ncbi:hypothetical protein CK203_041096 [Vitis vinifera]|uniref:Reverse transcriptase RNase H-like domain-containing protein n=1 Tax=Vitis vinifera TaxID=29760 RepID=A0A438H9V0_VITVI|nr:hypothetical protein CK203_041096 [Vitis vinifera]